MITVIVAQGQSVEVHTEEGSFVVSHGRTKVSVKCADETGPDDVGRQKVLWEKRISQSKSHADAETHTRRGQENTGTKVPQPAAASTSMQQTEEQQRPGQNRL